MCYPSEAETKTAVDRALKRLVQKDYHLLSHNLHERTITHRLAVHLTTEFPEWDVDCEYNRREYDVKRVNKLARSFFAEGRRSKDYLQTYENRAVYPDIIVHQRGKDNNLLVIEVKKNDRDDSADKEKLQAYLSQVNYRYAFFVRIFTGEQPEPNGAFYALDPIIGPVCQNKDD